MNDRTLPRARIPLESPPPRHGPGLKLLVLALMLVAIATAADIAWMSPGRATMAYNPQHAATQDATESATPASATPADHGAPMKAAARTGDSHPSVF